jgi:hypothetical protein
VGKDLIPRSVELTPRMPLKTISVRLAKPVRMRVAIFRETRSHDLKKKTHAVCRYYHMYTRLPYTALVEKHI